jgi:hypothetical protein
MQFKINEAPQLEQNRALVGLIALQLGQFIRFWLDLLDKDITRPL